MKISLHQVANKQLVRHPKMVDSNSNPYKFLVCCSVLCPTNLSAINIISS
jgi:hypothetical protein